MVLENTKMPASSDSELGEVWLKRLIAVAALQRERMVHAVFQPPDPRADISVLQVTLERTGTDSEVEVEAMKQVAVSETSVNFTGVEPGQYRVKVRPQGRDCDLSPEYCTELVSESIRIQSDHGDDVPIIVIVIAGSVVVVVFIVVLLLVVLLKRRARRNKPDLSISSVFVTSFASRELERRVTSYFCDFISEDLRLHVKYCLPRMPLENPRNFHPIATVDEIGAKENLLLRGDNSEKSSLLRKCKLHIILRFLYIQTQSRPEASSTVLYSSSDIQTCARHGISKGFDVPQDLLSLTAVEKSVLVTFISDCEIDKYDVTSLRTEPLMNSCIGVQDRTSSDDDVTVLMGKIHKQNVAYDKGSMCNRLHSHVPSPEEQRTACHFPGVQEYFLPKDIKELVALIQNHGPSLQPARHSEEPLASENWLLALSVFDKAAENIPGEVISDLENKSRFSDVVTIPGTETVDGDYFNNSLQMSSQSFPEHRDRNTLPSAASSTRTRYQRSLSQSSPCTVIAASELTASDSFSNVTDAEHDILGYTTHTHFDAHIPKFQQYGNDVLARYFTSVRKTAGHNVSPTQSSFSVSKEAIPGSRNSANSKVHRYVPEELTSLSPSLSNDDTDQYEPLTDDAESSTQIPLQRLISTKSSKTSGYESGETPSSDIGPPSWNSETVPWKSWNSSDYVYSCQMPSSLLTPDISLKVCPRLDPDFPSNINDPRRHGPDTSSFGQQPLVANDAAPKKHREVSHSFIYPADFVKSVIPPQNF